MKNIAFLLLVVFGIGLVSSCEKEPKEPVLDMSKAIAASNIAPAGQSIVLLEDEAENLIDFTWSAATYNLTDLETVKYILQMDLAGNNFEKPSELSSTTETSFSITISDLNNKLVAMGLAIDEAADVEFRVLSFINNTTDYTNTTSQVVSNTFSPYQGGEIEYPKLWVPGDYQGWAPDLAPVLQSFDSDGIYTGYIFFPEGGTFEFKFTSDPNWDGTNYGAGADPGTLDTDSEAGNLTVPGAGGYRITTDINTLTWTFELQNWGLIGEFNGWAEDIDLEWDAENNFLTLTTDIPAAADNRFKFRANDAWELNMGAIDPPDGKTLTIGGADIPITEGNYTFHLILSGKNPMYELIAN